jgi:tyrosyl-tRNA synthetase
MATANDLFAEYQWRGMVHTATDELAEVLANEKLTAYIGFDPSAASLHVGSLLPAMALARLQRFGHTPIAIVGGGTGLIGDPSGKTQERQLLTKEQLAATWPASARSSSPSWTSPPPATRRAWSTTPTGCARSASPTSCATSASTSR